MPLITFKSQLAQIGSSTILKLPLSASAKLPSRGMVMAEGTINEIPLQAPLEPDGKGSHWFKVEDALLKKMKASAGDTVTLAIEAVKEWPEPKVPDDLKKALAGNPQALKLWMDITPMSRWDWIRWIRSTKNSETRKKRIVVTLSKLNADKRRPCCFNRSMCTEPEVSNNGVLIEPK